MSPAHNRPTRASARPARRQVLSAAAGLTAAKFSSARTAHASDAPETPLVLDRLMFMVEERVRPAEVR